MARWFRLLLPILALCGWLAGGGGGALAVPAHHCCPSAGMSDHAAATTAPAQGHHQGHDQDAPRKCCMLGLCASSPPLTSLSSFDPAWRAPVSAAFWRSGVFARSGASLSPDLRPPIA